MDKITIENGLLALKERFGNENSYDAVEFIERVEKEIEQLQAENQQLNEDKSLLINDWQNAIQEVEQLKAENDEFRKTILELQEDVITSYSIHYTKLYEGW